MSQTESLDRATSTPTTSRSWWWFAAAALVVGHWPVAVGEALIGDLDAVDDLAAINDAAGQVVLAGLMHLLGGFVLAGMALGVVLVVQRRGAALARVGGILGLLAAVSAGGFAMFHLLLVEYAHQELDRAAMSEFAALRLNEGAGWWALPVVLILVVLPAAELLMLAGLARARLTPWWAIGVYLAGFVLHAVGWSNTVEVGSHAVMAAGLTIAGVSLARSRAAA
ncbi:MAG TPA: hypothetical protein VFD41_01550, partial [Actinomycetales bacterium]|nr:hypothetical protein [Actinomycetales bacterium]